MHHQHQGPAASSLETVEARHSRHIISIISIRAMLFLRTLDATLWTVSDDGTGAFLLVLEVCGYNAVASRFALAFKLGGPAQNAVSAAFFGQGILGQVPDLRWQSTPWPLLKGVGGSSQRVPTLWDNKQKVI